MIETKKCDVCHEEKPLLFFPSVGGYVAYCREHAISMGYIKEKKVQIRRDVGFTADIDKARRER